MENRTASTKIKIRQSGLDENGWIFLEPLSTAKFSWDDPYGQKFIDVCVISHHETYIQNVSLEMETNSSKDLQALGIQIIVVEMGDYKIVRLIDCKTMTTIDSQERTDSVLFIRWGTSSLQKEPHNATAPLELIMELGVVGVSLIDHRPKELLYFYLERVYMSYLSGFDAGTTSR